MSGHTLTVQETASYLRTLDDVLLLTHVRPDGDTVGSAAALCRALRDMGKTAYLLPNPEITATYEPYAAPYWAPEGFAPAHVVSVDIAALNLLPDNAAVYAPRIELAIDHHGSHGFFAARTCLDADAAACGEIVHDIIALLTAVTPDIALPLYVAIATDTGCFVYSNTTARTHRIAAALLDTGIDAAPVNKALFRTKSRTRLAMESRMTADMTLFDHDRVVVMTIPLSLRQELHATEADIEELSSLAALVEGSDCGVTLRELRPGVVKISLRTGPRVDASAVCQRLGGGGHKAAAGATVNGTMDEVRAAVLRAYQEVVG
jgi:phosphoesterase RecJ-like protein